MKGNIMKTTIATLTSLAVLGLSAPSVSAGDREWATAGKIPTGVVAGAAIVKALEPVPVYRTTTYYAPVVRAPSPAPIIIRSAPVLVQTVPVAVQRAPVIVYPQPVFVQSAPVYVQSAPVFVTPRPVVHFSVGFGRHHHHAPPVYRVCR